MHHFLRHRLATSSLALLLGGACSPASRSESVVAGGDPARGRASLDGFGCGACHQIPGVKGANGLVGPPLMMFARRAYIAGQLPNTPENLIRWIRDPQGVEPGTAMPNLGVGDATARDMAAYLYTLRGPFLVARWLQAAGSGSGLTGQQAENGPGIALPRGNRNPTHTPVPTVRRAPWQVTEWYLLRWPFLPGAAARGTALLQATSPPAICNVRQWMPARL